MDDSTTSSPPQSILLATDLSSRSDRALDRAVQLARQWDAALHVVHAVMPPTNLPVATPTWEAPWISVEDGLAEIEGQLRSDVGPLEEELKLRIHVDYGSPGEFILKIAEQEHCRLIVTGVARNETLGRMLLGDTVDFVTRRTKVPVLVVRNRCHAPYGSILAATDFSPASAEALHTVLALFPQSNTRLLHAYHIPFSEILNNDEIRAEFRELGEKAGREFLQAQGLPDDFPRIVREGSPAELIAKQLRDGPALVVVGSHGASGVAKALLGSTARRILNRTSADVLVVPFARRQA